jgi:cobyrinic acid a,c-diamide synthase
VIDGSALARSAAAMALGYARFDVGLTVAGVLFNRISGERHYQLLKTAVEAETDLPVVGYLGSDPTVTIANRHLGLTMALEQSERELYRRLGESAAKTVDLDLVETLAASAGELEVPSSMENQSRPSRARPSVRVGVAEDAAFCFYYSENLELLEAEGAELVRFSPIKDHVLPEVDLLYLGGGYPELHGPALASNTAMRTAIRSFAERGGAIYAECGGMMYLTESIRDFEGHSHDMVGLFPAEAVMRKPGLTLGYRELEITSACVLGEIGVTARGHEFHYSSLAPRGDLQRACVLRDARGEPRGPDGLLAGNALALYTHLHFSSQPLLAKALISSARARPMR